MMTTMSSKASRGFVCGGGGGGSSRPFSLVAMTMLLAFVTIVVFPVVVAAASTTAQKEHRRFGSLWSFPLLRRNRRNKGNGDDNDSDNDAIAAVVTAEEGDGKNGRPLSLGTAVGVGIVLAFNSGYMNGCCVSGGLASDRSSPKQAVAPLTGAFTLMGLGLASGDEKQFGTQLRVITSFVVGSTLASLFMNPNPKPFYLSPSCGPSFLLASLLVAASTRLSHLASSLTTTSSTGGSKNGGDAQFHYYQLAFCLLAAANGIQNCVTSVHSTNLVRTSHNSGVASDVGTFLGQCLQGNYDNLYKLKIFSALLFAFIAGGYVSYKATDIYAGTSLVLSAVVYLVVGLASFWYNGSTRTIKTE